LLLVANEGLTPDFNLNLPSQLIEECGRLGLPLSILKTYQTPEEFSKSIVHGGEEYGGQWKRFRASRRDSVYRPALVWLVAGAIEMRASDVESNHLLPPGMASASTGNASDASCPARWNLRGGLPHNHLAAPSA